MHLYDGEKTGNHTFLHLYDGEKTGMHAFLHLYDGEKTGMLKFFTDFFTASTAFGVKCLFTYYSH